MAAPFQNARLIDMKGIYKSFGGVMVLSNINLYIRKNEFVTLLGPSGCGKTTILRIIGGFETPSEGTLFFEGADMSSLPPHKRRVNTVFQEYALFSHMNVGENVGFGPSMKKIDKGVIKKKVAAMLELVGLPGFENRSISSLSGGQQQRVAIARALANEPEALLLDEPFGALDLKMREEMRIELKNMQRELGITFIHVTHDQDEALAMSDTVIVMKQGVIQQIGKPEDVYNEPENVFVANFVGQSNILDGYMVSDYYVNFLGITFECLDSGFAPGEPVDVVIRPEDVRITSESGGHVLATVKNVTFTGSHYTMYIETHINMEGTHDGQDCHDGQDRQDRHFGQDRQDRQDRYVGQDRHDGRFCYTWNVQSTEMSPVGSVVGLEIVPDAIHVMKKSKPENGNKEMQRERAPT